MKKGLVLGGQGIVMDREIFLVVEKHVNKADAWNLYSSFFFERSFAKLVDVKYFVGT